MPAIITRESVLNYDGEKVYEPREEVEKATFTAQNAWVVEEHPVELIVTKAKDIRGTVRNPVFAEDRIKADLVFFKDRSVEQAYRYPVEGWTEGEARKHCDKHSGTFEPATKEEDGEGDMVTDQAGDQEDDEREKLHEAAKAREQKYGIKFREGEGHLTPPEGYPQNEEYYGDPVNYKYPLKPQDRCQNALGRWSQYREEYTQPERNIVYERIVKAALGYNIAVKYNPDLPEARALPTSVKEKLEGYEASDALIGRVKTLINQLQS